MSDKLPSPLAEAFGYSPQDIRLNRDGKLSGGQRRSLWTRFIGALLGGLALLIAPILLSWSLFAWTGGFTADTFTSQASLFGYAVGLLLGVTFFATNRRGVLLLPDLIVGQAVQVTAPAQVWGRYLVLDTHYFIIDADALDLIRNGITYRAYILPRSNTLLSIEFAD